MSTRIVIDMRWANTKAERDKMWRKAMNTNIIENTNINEKYNCKAKCQYCGK